jgi:hypothetical protein
MVDTSQIRTAEETKSVSGTGSAATAGRVEATAERSRPNMNDSGLSQFTGDLPMSEDHLVYQPPKLELAQAIAQAGADIKQGLETLASALIDIECDDLDYQLKTDKEI